MTGRWIDALGQYVQDSGYGTLGTNVFLQEMPETDTDGPDIVIAIEPGDTMVVGGNRLVDNPAILLGVRAATFASAWDTCGQIRDLLRVIANQTVEGVYFLGVVPTAPLEDAGRDEKGRRQIRCRFGVFL